MITEISDEILRVILLKDHDPYPILAFLEKPSYLRDSSTDLQFSFCKRKLMLRPTKFVTKAKRFNQSFFNRF